MKYFYDTEFIEHTQDKRFLGLKYGKTKPTIDLISIGIVSEDGREMYAVSHEFNLKEAWNRYDLIDTTTLNVDAEWNRKYWIRENVLKPIHKELRVRELNELYSNLESYENYQTDRATYKELKRLLKKYGQSRVEIIQGIMAFFYPDIYAKFLDGIIEFINRSVEYGWGEKIELYGYYSAYDHVVFCWLFGKMIELPEDFPMYTKDLKQMYDEAQDKVINGVEIKKMDNYPKQENEHNALADARWNKKLYEFLINLK